MTTTNEDFWVWPADSQGRIVGPVAPEGPQPSAEAARAHARARARRGPTNRLVVRANDRGHPVAEYEAYTGREVGR
jgi:hypothetical protein